MEKDGFISLEWDEVSVEEMQSRATDIPSIAQKGVRLVTFPLARCQKN